MTGVQTCALPILDNAANTEGGTGCFRGSQAPSAPHRGVSRDTASPGLPAVCLPEAPLSTGSRASECVERSKGPGPPAAGITHTPDAHVFHQVSHLFILPWSEKEERPVNTQGVPLSSRSPHKFQPASSRLIRVQGLPTPAPEDQIGRASCRERVSSPV